MRKLKPFDLTQTQKETHMPEESIAMEVVGFAEDCATDPNYKERRLIMAMIGRAINDAIPTGKDANTAPKTKHTIQARVWLLSDSTEEDSFIWWLEKLDMEVETTLLRVRQMIKNNTELERQNRFFHRRRVKREAA